VLYTQHKGQDVQVLVLEKLMEIGFGSEGTVKVCKILEVENLHLISHTKDLIKGIEQLNVLLDFQ